METNNYEAAIEAILFTMGESVEIDKIAKALELTKAQVKKIVANMQKELESDSRGTIFVSEKDCRCHWRKI